MSNVTAEPEPRFFLHVERGKRVLWCLVCGRRTRIEDRPWAMTDAEAEHECGLPCGCWSQHAHEATSEDDCAHV